MKPKDMAEHLVLEVSFRIDEHFEPSDTTQFDFYNKKKREASIDLATLIADEVWSYLTQNEHMGEYYWQIVLEELENMK